MDISKFVDELNESPYQIMGAITGGGSRFIADYLERGGGSSTIKEFVVPYEQSCLNAFLGGAPREKYCSESTAREMAMASFRRFEEPNDEYDLGIGVTCSLTTGKGERESRVNQIFVAVHSTIRTSVYHLILNRDLPEQKERNHQEQFAVEAVYKALRFHTEPQKKFDDNKHEYYFSTSRDEVDQYLELGADYLAMTGETVVIFPGSFNPIHDGHRAMHTQAQELLGVEPLMEISTVNFEKPPLDYMEIENRMLVMDQEERACLLTQAPLIVDKVEWIRNTHNEIKSIVIVMGEDTLKRISITDQIGLFMNGVKFLVFPRGDGQIDWSEQSVISGLIHPKSYNLKFNSSEKSSKIRKTNEI